MVRCFLHLALSASSVARNWFISVLKASLDFSCFGSEDRVVNIWLFWVTILRIRSILSSFVSFSTIGSEEADWELEEEDFVKDWDICSDSRDYSEYIIVNRYNIWRDKRPKFVYRILEIRSYVFNLLWRCHRLQWLELIHKKRQYSQMGYRICKEILNLLFHIDHFKWIIFGRSIQSLFLPFLGRSLLIKPHN